MSASNPLLPDLTGDDLLMSFLVLFIALMLVAIAATFWPHR